MQTFRIIKNTVIGSITDLIPHSGARAAIITFVVVVPIAGGIVGTVLFGVALIVRYNKTKGSIKAL